MLPSMNLKEKKNGEKKGKHVCFIYKSKIYQQKKCIPFRKMMKEEIQPSIFETKKTFKKKNQNYFVLYFS